MMMRRELLMRTTCTLISIVALSLATPSLLAQQGVKPDHMQHRFDDPARLAKSFDDPARDKWQMPERVIDALAIKPGAAVADIGAGTGYFTMRLAQAASKPTVYAVDVEPKMVEHLKQRASAAHLANVVPVLASATSPNLPARVDVVLIVDTYHHLPNRVAYFRDLRASLTPSAHVAIVDFRKDAPEGPPVHFRFTPEQIIAEMQQAGYTLAATHDFLPRQHYLIFK